MSNGPTPGPEPAAPGEGGPNRTILIAVAVLLFAGVAVGAYLIGRAAADADEAEKRGAAKGRAAVERQYEKGAPGYDRIYQAGFSAGRAEGERAGQRRGERAGAERGRKVGFERGREIGELQGEREGIEQGATAALGGLTDWEPGSWYIVKLATGEQGVPFRIAVRKQMAEEERYAVCADNPADVCSERIPTG
jgi:hypothetical protein